MYGREVPAYTTLVEVAREVNEEVVAARGADAERLGSLDRVSAERHGAIRLGTVRVLAQVARIFRAELDAAWMSGAIRRDLADPISLCAAQRERSLDAVRRTLAPHLARS